MSPGVPPTTPNLGLPRYAPGDIEDFAAQINAIVDKLDTATPPTGTVVCFAGATAPAGWLLCNGASLLRSSYAALFAVISTTYGAADGTHFNVPNMIGRTAVHPDPSNAVIPSSPYGAINLGTMVGLGTYTLQNSEMPVHSHGAATGAYDVNHLHAATDSGHGHSASSSSSDGGHSHGTTDPKHGHNITNQGNQGFVWGSASTNNFGGGTALAAQHSALATDQQSTNININTGFASISTSTSIGTGTANISVGACDRSVNHTHTIGNDGGGAAHANMQPVTALNYIIKT